MSLIIRKLSSQTLLFGLAMALLAVSYASINSAQRHGPMLTFLFIIFALTLAAYLGVERKTAGRGKRGRDKHFPGAVALAPGCVLPHAALALAGVACPTHELAARSGGRVAAVALAGAIHAR